MTTADARQLDLLTQIANGINAMASAQKTGRGASSYSAAPAKPSGLQQRTQSKSHLTTGRLGDDEIIQAGGITQKVKNTIKSQADIWSKMSSESIEKQTEAFKKEMVEDLKRYESSQGRRASSDQIESMLTNIDEVVNEAMRSRHDDFTKKFNKMQEDAKDISWLFNPKKQAERLKQNMKNSALSVATKPLDMLAGAFGKRSKTHQIVRGDRLNAQEDHINKTMRDDDPRKIKKLESIRNKRKSLLSKPEKKLTKDQEAKLAKSKRRADVVPSNAGAGGSDADNEFERNEKKKDTKELIKSQDTTAKQVTKLVDLTTKGNELFTGFTGDARLSRKKEKSDGGILGSAISKVTSMLKGGGLVTKGVGLLTKAAAGAASFLGPAAAIGAAAVGGYALGTWLEKKFIAPITDKFYKERKERIANTGKASEEKADAQWSDEIKLRKKSNAGGVLSEGEWATREKLVRESMLLKHKDSILKGMATDNKYFNTWVESNGNEKRLMSHDVSVDQMAQIIRDEYIPKLSWVVGNQGRATDVLDDQSKLSSSNMKKLNKSWGEQGGFGGKRRKRDREIMQKRKASSDKKMGPGDVVEAKSNAQQKVNSKNSEKADAKDEKMIQTLTQTQSKPMVIQKEGSKTVNNYHGSNIKSMANNRINGEL